MILTLSLSTVWVPRVSNKSEIFPEFGGPKFLLSVQAARMKNTNGQRRYRFVIYVEFRGDRRLRGKFMAVFLRRLRLGAQPWNRL